MKKSLVLLPFAAILLMGCAQNGGQTTAAPTTGPTVPPAPTSVVPTTTETPTTTGQGGEVDVDSFALDFTDTKYKDDKIFPYIENNDITQFSMAGFTWNDRGAYASAGYDGAPNYVMLNNKKYGRPDGSFIGNSDKFVKTITAISITTPATGSSGNAEYALIASASKEIKALTDGDVVKEEKGGNSKTISATLDASKGYKYFAIFAKFDSTKADDKQYNGQLAALSVTLQ